MAISEGGHSKMGAERKHAATLKRVSKPEAKSDYFPDAATVEAALQAAQIGVWSWDIATNQVTWSSNLENIHRLPSGSFDGTFAFVQRDVHPDDQAQVLAAI